MEHKEYYKKYHKSYYTKNKDRLSERHKIYYKKYKEIKSNDEITLCITKEKINIVSFTISFD